MQKMIRSNSELPPHVANTYFGKRVSAHRANMGVRRRSHNQQLKALIGTKDAKFVSRSGRRLRGFPGRVKYNNWYVTECGGGGDCFFHSVGTAMGVSQETVRRWTAESVNETNIDLLLDYYHRVYPVGMWSRQSIMRLPTTQERVSALRAVITTNGPTYEGDDRTMALLVMNPRLCMGFLVATHTGEFHRQCFLSRYTRHMIVLMHLPGHWQLVVHKVQGDVHHRLRSTFDPYSDALPDFVKTKFAEIEVDPVEEFSTWEPKIELEVAKATHLSPVAEEIAHEPIEYAQPEEASSDVEMEDWHLDLPDLVDDSDPWIPQWDGHIEPDPLDESTWTGQNSPDHDPNYEVFYD